METTKRKIINIKVAIKAAHEQVWEMWSAPQHIIQWNNASNDWHTTKAENDLKAGGHFMS